MIRCLIHDCARAGSLEGPNVPTPPFANLPAAPKQYGVYFMCETQETRCVRLGVSRGPPVTLGGPAVQQQAEEGKISSPWRGRKMLSFMYFLLKSLVLALRPRSTPSGRRREPWACYGSANPRERKVDRVSGICADWARSDGKSTRTGVNGRIMTVMPHHAYGSPSSPSCRASSITSSRRRKST
jgi:hypothetical protein